MKVTKSSFCFAWISEKKLVCYKVCTQNNPKCNHNYTLLNGISTITPYARITHVHIAQVQFYSICKVKFCILPKRIRESRVFGLVCSRKLCAHLLCLSSVSVSVILCYSFRHQERIVARFYCFVHDPPKQIILTWFHTVDDSLPTFGAVRLKWICITIIVLVSQSNRNEHQRPSTRITSC